MSLAMIEVEAMAKKAARGAGFSWGVAEDAARATRWLCAAGLDGVGVLARVLAHATAPDAGAMRPEKLKGDWRAASGVLCPLLAGTSLSDSTALWAQNGELRMENVAVPLMLVPFAAHAARQLATPVLLEWNGARFVTNGSLISFTGAIEHAQAETAQMVLVGTGGAIVDPLPTHARALPIKEDWVALSWLAQRTYAPDTDHSRLKGAGAGLNDND